MSLQSDLQDLQNPNVRAYLDAIATVREQRNAIGNAVSVIEQTIQAQAAKEAEQQGFRNPADKYRWLDARAESLKLQSPDYARAQKAMREIMAMERQYYAPRQ